MVQWVEVDVRQKRTYHTTLRRAFVVLFRVDPAQWVHDALLEEAFDQREHLPVGDAFLY